MKQVVYFNLRLMGNINSPIIRSIKILLFLLIISYHAIAVNTITTTGSGNWNSTTPNQPWPSGNIPATGDNVIIGASFTLTVTDDRTCNTITIGSGSTLSINSGITLTATSLTFPHKSASNITGTLTGSGSLACTSFNVGDGTTSNGSSVTWTSTLSSTLSSIHATGNLTIQSTNNGSRLNNGIFNLQSGTMTVDGSVVTTNGTGTTSTLSLASGAQTGTLIIGGGTPFSLSGTAGQNVITLNGTSATVNYSGGTQAVQAVTYTNLTLSGSGTKDLTSVSTINGNLALSGTATATTATAMTVGGTLSIGDGTTFTAAGFNVTVTGATTVGGGTSGNLTISSSTGTKTFTGLVTISSGGTWTNTSANSAVTFTGGITNNGTFNAGTGTHTFNATQSLSGTLSIPSITVSSGTLTNSGTLTITSALAGSGGLTNTGTLNINFTGALGITTLTATGSGNTVNYGYAGTQTVKAVTYTNLTLSGSGAKDLTSISTINGNLTLSGSATATTSAAMTVGGNITLSGTAQLTTGNTLSVAGTLSIGDGTTFTAAGYNLTITGTTTVGGGTTGNLTISSATGTKTFGPVTISSGGTWTNTSSNSDVTFNGVSGGITNNGTFNAGTGVHTFSTNSQTLWGTLSIPSITVSSVTLTNSGTLTVTSALAGSGGLTNTGTLNINFTGTPGIATLTVNGSGNIVNYGYAGTQTVFPTDYYHLTLSSSGAKTLPIGTRTVSGNLTLSGTSSATTAGNLTISGNLSIADGTAFTAAGYDLTVSGTITVGGTTSGSFTISSATGAKTFGAVTIASGGTWSNASANSDVTFKGGITNNGTFSAGTGVHTFSTNVQSLSGTFSIPQITVTGITLTNGNTLTVGTALSGTGTLAQASGASLTLSGTGGISAIDATTNGSNTVYYNGSSQTVGAFNYYNLNLSSATGISLPAGTVGIKGTFTFGTAITSTNTGTINFNGSSQTLPVFDFYSLSLTSATGTLLPSGTIGISGTFTPGTITSASTGTINFKGSSQTIPAFNYNNLNLTSASGTSFASGTIGIAGTFTPANINSANTGTIDFNGSNQTVPSFTYVNLNTSGSGTKTLGGAVTTNGSLTIGNGSTLDISAANNYSISVKGNWINNGGTFQYWAGTVTFNGITIGPGGQTIDGSATTQSFNNIVVNVSGQPLSIGSRTTTLILYGGLTLTAGGFNSGTATVQVEGDWTNNTSTAAFTSSGTVIFNKDHNGAQTVGGSSSTTFKNVTVSGQVPELTLAKSITVQGTLTLTNRNVNTGANEVKADAIVRNTIGHVIGNLSKSFSSLTLSRTFEIGNSANYLPVTVTFTSVSIAGYLTIKTTNGPHSAVSTSNIDSAKCIYRNWTVSKDALTFSDYSITLSYIDPNDHHGSTSPNAFLIGLYKSSTWYYPSVYGTPTATSLTATGITSVGDFAIGNGIPSATQSPQTIYWTDLVGTTISSNVLTKTSSTGWGNGGAASENALVYNNNGWIKLTFPNSASITGTKGFGFTNLNVDVNYTTIDFGFVISPSRLSIYECGLLRGSFGGLLVNDELVIERIASTIYYRKNGNLIYTSTINSNNTLVVDAAIYDNNSYFDGMVCSFALPGAFVIDATVSNQVGGTLASISTQLSGGSSPFTSVWDGIIYPDDNDFTQGLDTIPPLDSLVIDSTVFYAFDSLRENRSWSPIESGIHTLELTDNANYARDYQFFVGDDIDWVNPNSLSISTAAIPKRKTGESTYFYGDGDKLIKNSTNGWSNGYAYSENYFDNYNYGYMEFTVPQINTAQEIGYKLVGHDGGMNISNGIEFSFLFDMTTGFTIKELGQSQYSGSYRAGDIFSIESVYNANAQIQTIIYKQNNVTIRSLPIAVSSYKLYLLWVNLYSNSASISNVLLAFKSNLTISALINDASCAAPSSGSIDLTLSSWFTSPICTYQWSYNSNTISTSQDISNLIPGDYSVAISCQNLVPPTVNTTYSVANKIYWDQLYNASLVSGSPNSIYKSAGAAAAWDSWALSSNVLMGTDGGWTEFKIDNLTKWVCYGFQLENSSLSNPLILKYGIVGGMIGPFYIYMVVENGTIVFMSGWMPNLSLNNVFRINKDLASNTIKYYRNNQLIYTSATFPNQNLRVGAGMSIQNSHIYNARSSFGCRDINNAYALLKDKPDGGFYIPPYGRLRFKYVEEYVDNGNALQFNIYDNFHNLVASNATTGPSLAVEYKDNLYTLDLLSLNTSILNGYFILEVINKKSEKSYLRFKH